MPEIEIIRVLRDGPDAFYVIETDGGIIHESDENFGVTDLADIGADYGITRWSEATDADRSEMVSYLSEDLVLIGWAETPITRDDVETYNDRGFDARRPAVNIKVYNLNLPTGAEWADLVSEFELDARLTALSLSDLRDLVEAYLEKDDDNTFFQLACESGFERAADDAKELFTGYDINVWNAGRSGGWLTVEGLPDVEVWGVDLLTKWKTFTEYCEAEVADIPRSMAWYVLANAQDQLAGRVVRVTLTIVLSDDDDREFHESLQHGWGNKLDLGVDSTVTAHFLD